MRFRTICTVPTLLAAAACGGDFNELPAPVATQPPPTATATTPPPAVAATPRFENPGGMWMPHQIAAHAAKLKELGLQIDPQQLTDPTSDLLSAVVSLGGCSASFVSAEGLIITNHHCATGALQFNSTPDQNLLKNGFLAKTRAEERSNGPSARVFVTRAVTEVTKDILDGIASVTDDQARYKKIESRQKDMVAACEKDRPEIRCNVASFYEGERYYKVEQLEIKDVRLAYAPAAGAGNYGGEVDNWRWPRHTDDVAFFRAYVGKDGKPAPYSTENVPYGSTHHLTLASSPLKEGDLVFVAGYPGRTYQLKTKGEVEEAVGWSYPRRIKQYEEYIAVVEAEKAKDADVAIKGTSLTRGLNNALTNFKGQVEGLGGGGLAADKAKAEADLRAFIDADPKRKAEYGSVLDEMAKLEAESVARREKDASLREVFGFARLLSSAYTIVRIAEERAKPDAERHPAYQERNWKNIADGQASLEKNYAKPLDKAVLRLALERIARLPAADQTEALKVVLGPAKPDAASIARAVDKLYATTTLEPKQTRLDLIQKATTADLKKSRDPLIRVALSLRPLMKAMDDHDEAYAGRMAILKPKYIKAMRELAGRDIAPDANSTLRITYGTVRGYKPKPDAAMYTPFTLLAQVVAKHTGTEPFNAPAKLIEAAKAKKVGPYADARLGDVPVDFLSDLHITGGNSGSATLNAKGELVGLAFDGNYEAMGSDWLFQPAITRTIHVDLRYILWVMDAVDGAHALLREMGRTPAME